MNYRTLHVKQPDVASGVWPETKPLRPTGVRGSRFAHAYPLSHLESIDWVKIKICHGCYVSAVCPTFKIGLSRRNVAKVRRDKMIERIWDESKTSSFRLDKKCKLTVPERPACKLFCIFIASTTASSCPSWTCQNRIDSDLRSSCQ